MTTLLNAGFAEAVLEADGFPMRVYSAIGNHRTLVLVVNPLCVGIGLAAPLLNALSPRFDVLAWESRGKLAPRTPMSTPKALRPADHIRDVRSICEQLEIERIDHIVGVCSGGEIAALLAASPEFRPRTLTLAAASLRLPNVRRTPYQAAILPLCEAISRKGPVAHEALRAAFARPQIEADPLAVELDRMNLEPFADAETMLLYAESIRNLMTDLVPDKACETVRRISMPTLILHARDDDIIHPDTADALHREIEGSKLVLYETGGHFLFHRVPASIDRVMEFMSEAPQHLE